MVRGGWLVPEGRGGGVEPSGTGGSDIVKAMYESGELTEALANYKAANKDE